MSKSPLGRGLQHLITPAKPAAAAAPVAEGEHILEVPLADITPSPLQPRSTFVAESLAELVESIREKGIIQPLIVRRINNKLELIAGERRWRAATVVALSKVPVIIREATDLEVLELALIENIQREDLNPIEEAKAYARLVSEFGLKQEAIAKKVGKSRATVANTMRLLDLDTDLQSHIVHERLSVGHAKALLGISNSQERSAIASLVMRKSLSVRATENLVTDHLSKTQGGAPTNRRRKTSPEVPAAVRHLENRLQQHFSTRVEIRHGESKGHIVIEYYGNDDLDRLLQALGIAEE